MERQGLISELEKKSKAELSEILSRQEKILNNKRFVQTLPDKGKKISDFVERVRLALAKKEVEEKKQASLDSVRTQFQARYQQAFTQRQHVVSSAVQPARTRLTENDDLMNTEPSHTLEATKTVNDESSSESLCIENTDMRETSSGDIAASGNADRAKDTDLVEAFERVTLSEESGVPPRDSTPFLSSQQKKPHYIEVLEKSENKGTKARFKLNQLQVKSASPSPGQSPGSVIPLSAEARRQRDRKHLDDITAAKLPPLHHSPAQLLSLEESATLLKEQTKKSQELQAKLAAQKLAESLTGGMNRYNPEGGTLATYREVHDDGALSEED